MSEEGGRARRRLRRALDAEQALEVVGLRVLRGGLQRGRALLLHQLLVQLLLLLQVLLLLLLLLLLRLLLLLLALQEELLLLLLLLLLRLVEVLVELRHGLDARHRQLGL